MEKSLLNQDNKALVWAFWDSLANLSPGTNCGDALPQLVDNLIWHGPDPINSLRGKNAFLEQFWAPFRYSFTDLTRETFLFFGGQSNGRRDGVLAMDGRMWITGTGVFTGTFAADYLGIPATHQQVSIRWGEFCHIQAGKIEEIYFLIDLIDLMDQAGVNPLPAILAKTSTYLPPYARDGILLDAQDTHDSQFTLEHIRRFIFDGLNEYNQTDINSMGLASFFDPNVRWYGPGGIGACYGRTEFEGCHQIPWLNAFPDRKVQDLDALFAEGCYSGGPGWAGVKATHLGVYKGVPATGRSLDINGLDWWKREGERIVENWVFVDMVHLFRQMGVSLLAPVNR